MAQYKNSDYEIFEDGKCYSNKSKKYLKPKMSITYPTYHLTLPEGKKSVAVHRMVAETFLEHDEIHCIVNHIDGNTHNFNLSNLEWVTPKENTQHAIKNKLKPISSKKNAIFYTSDLAGEFWKKVKDYQYEVSSCGRVKNITTNRLLRPYIDNSGGYSVVRLWKNGKGILHRIHVLVYSNFNEDYDLKGFVVNHKDGNKNNNNINNLEKISYQENNLHATYIIKTHNCCKKIKQIDKETKTIIKIYNSIAEAYRETKINNISRAIKTNRMAGGYYWQFID